MECLYGKETCDCFKCTVCELCTNGSQIHRSCWKFSASLLAGSEEELPTEEMEAEAIAVQPDTPLSAETESNSSIGEAFEEEMDGMVWQFKHTITDIDVAQKYLVKNYPDEDFNGTMFQRISLPTYLSCEVSKFQFFLMQNQWGKEIFHSKGPYRMRKGLHVRKGKIYHLNCVDDESDGYDVGQFTRGILTVESPSRTKMLNMMRKYPDYFFCTVCEQYVFFGPEYQSDIVYELPSEDSFPKCEILDKSLYIDDNNFAHIYVNKQFEQEVLTFSATNNSLNIPDEQ